MAMSYLKILKLSTVLNLVTKLKMRLTLFLLHRTHMACTGKTCLFNDYCLPDCEAVYSSRKVPKFRRN